MHRFVTSVFVCLCVMTVFIAKDARAELILDGVNDEQRKNILAYIELDGESCDAEPWRVRRRFKTADDRIRKALEAYGFYSVEITKQLSWADDCWRAEFRVDPGKPVTLRKVELSLTGDAGEDPEFAGVLEAAGLVPGQTLRHRNYNTTKQRIQSLAADRGYFEGDFDAAKIEIWPDDYAADISLAFESGARYHFGNITVQQDFLEPEFVDRLIQFDTGSPYLSSDLSSIQQRLNVSGYFSSVEIRPDTRSNEAQQVPVEILLLPAERITYGVGLGFSTDTGPRLRGGYENKRLNRKGHQFNSQLLLSEVLSEVSASYRVPLRHPHVEWLTYSTGVQFEDTDTADSDRYSFGVKRGKQLSTDWIRTDALSLIFDRYAVSTDRDRSRLLMPSVGFNQKRADQLINPERGHRIGVEIRGASDALGSTTSFLQLTASAKWIRRVGDAGRALLRVGAGTTVKQSFSELPPDVRFFAGGIESVRGYGYENLGPEDDAGLVIGGSHLLHGSVEYDRFFYGNFAWAVFVDAGNAFDDREINSRIGAGAGVKWRSPIGPLRFYLAHPVNYSDRTVRLHISIGPDL